MCTCLYLCMRACLCAVFTHTSSALRVCHARVHGVGASPKPQRACLLGPQDARLGGLCRTCPRLHPAELGTQDRGLLSRGPAGDDSAFPELQRSQAEPDLPGVGG